MNNEKEKAINEKRVFEDFKENMKNPN